VRNAATEILPQTRFVRACKCGGPDDGTFP
jgi:hypothetical protein